MTFRLFACFSCSFQGTNWARGGIATQSSIYGPERPQNAIDGRRGSIIHTRYDYRPWWRVDLRAVYKVNYVTITNRVTNCCASRLNGAEIRIGNSLSDNGNRNKRYIHFNFNFISGIYQTPISRDTYKYEIRVIMNISQQMTGKWSLKKRAERTMLCFNETRKQLSKYHCKHYILV